MVRLDRITMQGFKSFANKVMVPFPAGFNVIAGPNGSGKSNICDAITFVLGTSSAREIRAQKLQNLLFNGAKSRKPADYCEVTLYIDNGDKAIANVDNEIKITRRITRSGISVYKLNGMTVTRGKILDMLANSKISPEGYNIIMQGDVTRIIEMSNIERRDVIDEIAGIAEFDEKKEKAARELERVEMLVRESMIVVAEKQRLVSRLKAEKDVAELYQKLGSQLRTSRASLLNARAKVLEGKLASIENNLLTETEKFNEHEKEFGDIEKGSEEKEKLIRSIGDEIIQKSKNYGLVRSIEKIRAEILRRKDRIDVNNREISRLKSSTISNDIVKEILNQNLKGVYGTLYSLVNIPPQYAIALEVALGHHRNDIVVETDEIAAACIKFLKERRLGRARFIPLNKIRGREKKPVKENIIGYAIDLITFDSKLEHAMQYVLGSTIVVDNIDTARKFRGFRVVTLDGDLIEPSGAMVGGYYKRMRGFGEGIEKLQRENALLETEIEKSEEELDALKEKEEKESEEVVILQNRRDTLENELEALRKNRKDVYEQRLILQGSISKLRIEKAKLEAEIDNVRLEFEEFSDVKEFLMLPIEELQNNIRNYVIEINRLGPVNMRAIEEYGTIRIEFDEMRKKMDKLLDEKGAITKIIQEVETKRRGKFMETLNNISENFSAIYRDLSSGTGRLRMEEENNIDSGLIIEASPAGKNVVNLDAMSGGEKTLTSLAFLFAIMQLHSSPFYILDEVDAALDKANTKKIVDVIKKYSKNNQFIVISHNDFTVQEADKVFGVSIEDGVSKIFGIELPRE